MMTPIAEAGLLTLGTRVRPFIMDGAWLAFDANGVLVEKTTHSIQRPSPEQKGFAHDMLRRLNREMHHDGRWAVGWTDWDMQRGHYTRVMFLFLDKHSDLQFVVDDDEPLIFMLIAADRLIEQCEEAWENWRSHLADVGVKDEQKIAAALGQQSVDHTADSGVPNAD
jgi:hypothetical protein